MKTYQEPEIRRIFKSQNYKYASLRNSEGKTIVTYNTESNKNVKASHKVEEAFERLKILPDGMYTFCFANSKGRNVQPDEFTFLKGNVAVDDMGKQFNFQVVPQQQQPIKNEYERVLTYPEVINLQMELTRVKFELDSTKRELDKANIEIASLEAELKELESKGLSDDPSHPAKWLENLGTTFMPVIDKFMTQRDRQMDIEEKKLNVQNQQKRKKTAIVGLPPIGSEELEKFIDIISNYPDEKYSHVMAKIKENNPQHFEYITNALENVEEEEEDENE